MNYIRLELIYIQKNLNCKIDEMCALLLQYTWRMLPIILEFAHWERAARSEEKETI